MGRSPCCAKEGLNRGAWTAIEDKILVDYIKAHGEGRWRNLPKKAGLKRCGKSCRLRWVNYLRPDIKRGNISKDEEELIIRLHKLLGNRWSLIAGRLPGRTDNEIKNYWNTNLGKKVQDQQSLCRAGRHHTKPHEKIVNKVDSQSPTNATNQTSPPIMDSHVVHTKAIKCTKVVIDPHLNKTEYCDTNMVTRPSMHREIPMVKPLLESNTNDGLSNLFASGENYAQDSMFDFNMGDFCLSDLFNSELANLCDFNFSNDNSNDLSPPLSTQPLVFSEEMLQDLTAINCVQPFAAAILDSGEKWQ